MTNEELIIQYLIEKDEPLNIIEIYDLIYNAGDKAVPERRDRRLKLTNISQALYRLCGQNKTALIKPHGRRYHYCLPEWYADDKLKQEYHYKLENKLSRRIAVALVDDQALFRKGLKELLHSFGDLDIDVTIEADNGSGLIAQLEDESKMPNVCILSSPAIMLNNNQALKTIKQHSSKLRVLVIVPHYNEFTFCKMLSDGANGYLPKSCQPDELLEAISTLHKQKFYTANVPPNIWESLEYFQKRFFISDLQQQFLELSAKDLNYDEIAQIMGKSERTVQGYRDTLFRNFQTRNRVSLNMFAIRNGIIEYT